MDLPKKISRHYLSIFSFAIVIVLYFAKKVNLSFLYSGIRANNYLDIVLDLRYLFLVCGTLFGLLYLYRFKKWVTVYIGFMSLLLGYISLYNNIIFHRIERLLLLTCLIFSIYVWAKYIIPQSIKFANILAVAVISIPLLFDHFLVSESSSVFLLLYFGFLGYLINHKRQYKPLLYSLLGYLVLNVLIAVLQIVSGKSVGFSILGESVFDLSSQVGLGSEVIGGYHFLRGYGLFAHPNIMGFFGVINTIFFVFASKLTPQIRKTGIALGFALCILSFSRMAWLSMILLLVCGLYKSRFQNWQLFSIAGILGIATTTVFMVRYNLSDVYRISDFHKFWEAYQYTSVNQKLFGIGLGGYPLFLKVHFPDVQLWQYEPVHNTFLLIWIELGVLPIIGVISIIIFWKKLIIGKW